MQSSIKIVVIDYYMEAPKLGLDVTYSEFRSSSISQIPVLRCFGSTSDGKKICVHIHGVFPYLYIPYDGRGNPDQIMHQIASGLDKAINVSFNQANSNAQHVYKVSLVSGIPMYGYHVKKHQFFKIYLYNPKLVGKVGSLLLNKAIMGQVFQPHEIHLSFTLQFMIDYNLHGMSNLLISEMRYRMDRDKPHYDIDEELFLPLSIEKTSFCELEGDIFAENILNRQEILSGNLAINPGISALWEDEKQRRRNKNQSSQLGDYLELKNTASAPSKTHQIFHQALKEKLAVASTDIDVSKQNPDTSIYPAESPTVVNIQNASFVDIHCPSSLELSLDDTINVSSSEIFSKTLTPNDMTMDSDVQDMLHLLEELANEKVNAAEEDGSILSQLLTEEPIDEAVDLLDLSMPLAALTTPIKTYSMTCTNSNAEDVNYLKTTVIPQIDGQVEESNSVDNCIISSRQRLHKKEHLAVLPSTCEGKKCMESSSTIARGPKQNSGRLIPTLESNLDADDVPVQLNKLIVRIEPMNLEKICRPLLKHTPTIRSEQERIEETFRLVRCRNNRLYENSRVKIIRKTINARDNATVNILKRHVSPKFKMVVGRKWFLGNEDISLGTNRLLKYGSRCRLASNIYVNCDGAMDSSSENEDEITVSQKPVEAKIESLYAPLGINVTGSGSVQSVDARELSGDGQLSRHCKINEENRPHAQDSQQAVLLHHKRKLFSCDNSTLSHTTPCSKAIAIDFQSEILQNNLQNYDGNSSDSDIFSDHCDQKTTTLKRVDLDISDKSDLLSCDMAKKCFSSSSSKNRKSSETTSLNVVLHQSRIFHQNSTNHLYRPSVKAPTKSNVESSLEVYNFPSKQSEEPFYSNIDDYTGPVEVGHRVLRICSKTTAHMSEFTSVFNALNSHRKSFIENVANLTYNCNNIYSLKLAHCKNKAVTLCTVIKPPTVKIVKEWIESNSIAYKEPASSLEVTTEGRTKIYISNSPGDESNLDLSLSLTPCSLTQADTCNQLKTSPIIGPNRKIEQLKDSIIGKEEFSTSCQISGLSLQNSFGFDKSVQDLQAARAVVQPQYLTTMVIELHIRTRGDFKPDPQLDSICAIFYSIFNDVPNPDRSKAKGIITVNCLPTELNAPRSEFLDGIGIDCDITYVETEEALIYTFVNFVKKWDPDILAGYEIEMLSWGYLVERSSVLSISLLPLLGRSQLHKFGKTKLTYDKGEFETNVIGRIVLNVWRIMRHEIALQSYTFESVVYHLLHRRVPLYTSKDLTLWWDHRSNLYRHRVVRYYLQRTDTILELFDKQDFLNRTSELAKLFGILFYEVLSRGSQFRVESMMLRLAKPLNYIPVSPDSQQRACMKAPEYVPLIMEPKSEFYTDPVIVLDFQSLYPSIIIAYNYCFTTCLGRVNKLGSNNPFEFGATQLKISKNIVNKLCKRELLNYSPCGVAFVKQKVREGILPRMLKEVLDTRLMVKNSMKENKGNDSLQKVLHNRQLGLKLIANVTYGYTAANFSGRMCCVEVGDSVVSKGRETLQRAIALVESTTEWGAKVVYGDTDSMFVLVPGKSRKDAFTIGKKIADAVTANNPDPVKLKLEKVYQPCILQTKKRYVGYMYESVEETKPIYEAKGIETVRRDGCPAVSKMLQKCLTILFETKDVSLIKNYVLKQFNKIQSGRASIQDLTFAKEYRGSNGYKAGACVPALELARKWGSVDKRNEPRSGERVPYVIVNGPPGLPLIRLVRSPRDLLSDNSLRPNALYYITKVIIPPINRCLNLIGADVNVWFQKMPRKNKQNLPNSSPNVKSTISQYFISNICASCSQPSQGGLCQKCRNQPNVTAATLTEKSKKWEENYNNSLLICQSCTTSQGQVSCVSLDCPVLYRRIQTLNDQQQCGYVRELLTNFF